MTSMNRDQVKEMWSERATLIANDSCVTHRDLFQRKLEIDVIVPHLLPTDDVLDMGCGNGWTTSQLAPHCRRITGMDYSEEMIARATREHREIATGQWKVMDVLK